MVQSLCSVYGLGSLPVSLKCVSRNVFVDRKSSDIATMIIILP